VNLWFDDVHSPWIPNEQAEKEKNPNVAKNLRPVISEMDKQVGRLMEGLQTLGIDDRTLVIFTSDNGPYPHLRGRTGELRGCKFSLYDGGLRLPFIARWPGVVPAGVVNKENVVAAVDMFPTLCYIAGVKLPRSVAFDGENMTEALKSVIATSRTQPLMWEYGRNAKFFGYPKLVEDRSPNLAIRDGRWKLLVNTDSENAELYDLSTDPSEANNIAAAHPEIAERLKSEVLNWRQSLPSVSASKN
jgi:arylsulfatase A-like enzyme